MRAVKVLGATFNKAGQLLSTRRDLLAPEPSISRERCRTGLSLFTTMSSWTSYERIPEDALAYR